MWPVPLSNNWPPNDWEDFCGRTKWATFARLASLAEYAQIETTITVQLASSAQAHEYQRLVGRNACCESDALRNALKDR